MPTYHDLVVRCPACIADGKCSGQLKSGQWYHAVCNGKIQIGDNAFYKCASCKLESRVENWLYNCEKQTMIPYFQFITSSNTNRKKFMPTTSANLALALSLSASVTYKGGVRWIKVCLDNLGNHW